MTRTLTILYSLDAFVLAVLTLGNCKIGETISSVAWELDHDGKRLGKILRPTIDWFFHGIEVDHCLQALQTYLRISGSKR